MNEKTASPKVLSQTGFTLIELMIALMIIGIFASIAFPSYRRYIIVNAERQAQSAMKQTSMDLERWRASSLTFRGFYPLRCSAGDRCYDDTDNKTLYIPVGSNANNYRYKILLTSMDNTADTAKNSVSLITTGSTINQAVGRQWQMVAQPNLNLTGAAMLYLNSQRTECKTVDSTVDVNTLQTSHSCGTDSQNW